MFVRTKRVSVDDFDWERSYIWVQDVKWLRGPKQESGDNSDRVPLFCGQTKRVYTASRKKMEANYLYVRVEHAWKPRFNPQKAVFVSETCLVAFGSEGVERLAAGFAILRDITGRYSSISPEQFASDYTVVGEVGAPRPVSPFVY